MLTKKDMVCIDRLVKERRNSIANALELHLSCTNTSIWADIEVNTNMAMVFYHGLLALLSRNHATVNLSCNCLLSIVQCNRVGAFNAITGVPIPNTLGHLEQTSMHDSIKSWALNRNNGHHGRHSFHNVRTRRHSGRDSPYSYRHSRHGNRRSSHGN